MQLNGLDPLLSVLGVLRSQVPHAVVYTYVQPALVKLVGLSKKREREEREQIGQVSFYIFFFSDYLAAVARHEK